VANQLPSHVNTAAKINAYWHGKQAYTKTITVCAAVVLIVLAVPLLAFGEVVQPFAGQNTTVDIRLTVAITVGLSLTVAGLTYKNRKQREELITLRERCRNYEQQALDSGQ
jgi:hypothetical protein